MFESAIGTRQIRTSSKVAAPLTNLLEVFFSFLDGSEQLRARGPVPVNDAISRLGGTVPEIMVQCA